mmetsp:Transcript_45613/g.127146  ORF Transcript_45613/g.127146 Transcript_45613/m.127146 type:complete len:344 (-) Transcript_45613:103-1134(-)
MCRCRSLFTCLESWTPREAAAPEAQRVVPYRRHVLTAPAASEREARRPCGLGAAPQIAPGAAGRRCAEPCGAGGTARGPARALPEEQRDRIAFLRPTEALRLSRERERLLKDDVQPSTYTPRGVAQRGPPALSHRHIAKFDDAAGALPGIHGGHALRDASVELFALAARNQLEEVAAGLDVAELFDERTARPENGETPVADTDLHGHLALEHRGTLVDGRRLRPIRGRGGGLRGLRGRALRKLPGERALGALGGALVGLLRQGRHGLAESRIKLLAQADEVVPGAPQADVSDMEALHANAVPHGVLHPYVEHGSELRLRAFALPFAQALLQTLPVFGVGHEVL